MVLGLSGRFNLFCLRLNYKKLGDAVLFSDVFYPGNAGTVIILSAPPGLCGFKIGQT